MGYRSTYGEGNKSYNDTPSYDPGKQLKAKKALENLFGPPKKTETDLCKDGHNWVVHRDGPVRCSKCKMRKRDEGKSGKFSTF